MAIEVRCVWKLGEAIYDVNPDSTASWIHIGDLVFLEVLGKPILFINSYEAAIELLEKRWSIYSSRPHFVMAMEL